MILYSMDYSKLDIKELLTHTPSELTDMGICPTCLDRQSNHALYGDDSELKTYEDDDIECLFVPNPRSDGHMMISTKTHYHDMLEAPDYINEKIIRFARAYMGIIKEVYNCERVYLCTMADGPMNHNHVQLIPRYSFEQRGSKNFVKPRKKYQFNKEIFELVKQKITEYSKNNK